MTVTNPLVQYQSSKQQLGTSTASDKDSTSTIGIIFVPQVVAMIHLYN